MARKADQQNLDRLRDAIIKNPEQPAGRLATLLGRDNKSVNRDLPKLEERGDMLMEDGNGLISWFGRCR